MLVDQRGQGFVFFWQQIGQRGTYRACVIAGDFCTRLDDAHGIAGLAVTDVEVRQEEVVDDLVDSGVIFPGNGVVYSNPDYSSTAVPLTINEGGSYSYYKIYMGDDLVRTVFISPNGAATVNLPAGTYRMNEAHGELWFGEDDMFGDDGSYYRCSFGGEETFELRSGYSYEISSSGEGTGIGNSPTDRESF